MTPLDQWSQRTFSTPDDVRLARGPGTRRFAENAYHTTMAVLLLAVIVGLTAAAIGVTP